MKLKPSAWMLQLSPSENDGIPKEEINNFKMVLLISLQSAPRAAQRDTPHISDQSFSTRVRVDLDCRFQRIAKP